VICIAGAWCEAAGRTRTHWPPALRVPVWTAWERIEQELAVLAGACPALPWTATRDECVLASPVPSPPSAGERARVRGPARLEIYDPALRRELTTQLQQYGWTFTEDVNTRAALVVLSAEPASPELLDAIRQRCQTIAPAEVIAITTWPLPEWTEQLRAAGVCAVVNPLQPTDLASTVEGLEF